MPDLSTSIREYYDAAAEPVDVPEILERSGHRRVVPNWAVAVAAGIAVFVLIGGFVWLISGTDSEVIEEPMPTVTTSAPTTVPDETPVSVPDETTPSTVPGTTVPVAPIPDVSASGLLASSFINEVWDLAMAPDGTVWVATRGGVVQWDAGSSVRAVYGEADGLPAAGVERIVVATDGTVWAAGDGWIAYYDETWQPMEIDVGEMAADTTGGVWAVGGEALFHLDRSDMEQISIPERFGWGSFDAVALDGAGRVWMVSGDGDHGVVVYDGGNWQEFTIADGLPGHILSGIATAPDGTVWISTEAVDHGVPDPGEDPNVAAAGVASHDGETWTTYTTADGLATNEGTVVVAPDGTVWVVHDGAISRLDGDTWTVFDVTDSRRSGSVGGLDGTLWLLTDNGIVHFDGTDTTRYVVPAEMAPPPAPSFSLEPTASAAGSVDAGPFGEIRWQAYQEPDGYGIGDGVASPHGFVAIGESAVTSPDGVTWTTVEPPLNARNLAASGDDLYALGAGAVRLTWTGTTWRAANVLEINGLGPDRSIEQMAFGDGVTVMTTGIQVFFSTDGTTFDPALQSPDSALLRSAGNTGRCQPSFGGGGGENEIGPIAATEGGFVALSAGVPGGWNDFPLCEPVVWTSSDGSTWDLDSAESPFGPTAYVYDMAERDGRLVAVGGQGGDMGLGSEPTLWVSEDGVSWNKIPPERIDGSIAEHPVSIAAGEAGWVVLHGDALMYSVDGLNWVAPEGPPKIPWGYGVPGLVVGTDRILVPGMVGEINR